MAVLPSFYNVMLKASVARVWMQVLQSMSRDTSYDIFREASRLHYDLAGMLRHTASSSKLRAVRSLAAELLENAKV